MVNNMSITTNTTNAINHAAGVVTFSLLYDSKIPSVGDVDDYKDSDADDGNWEGDPVGNTDGDAEGTGDGN